MRNWSLSLTDLDFLVRAALFAGDEKRDELIERVVSGAVEAHVYKMAEEHSHPRYGNGSLVDLLGAAPRVQTRVTLDLRYLETLQCALDAVIRYYPRVQERHLGIDGSAARREGSRDSPQSVQ